MNTADLDYHLRYKSSIYWLGQYCRGFDDFWFDQSYLAKRDNYFRKPALQLGIHHFLAEQVHCKSKVYMILSYFELLDAEEDFRLPFLELSHLKW